MMQIEMETEKLAKSIVAEILPSIISELRIKPEGAKKGWLDTKAAAAYLGITKEALYKYCASGSVAYSQEGGAGGKMYFRPSDLDEFRLKNLVMPR